MKVALATCQVFSLLALSAGDYCMGNPKFLLTGWTGDGKTEFCNQFDTSPCPRGNSGFAEQSDTSEVHIGEHMLDTPGFGDNRVQKSGDSLHASLDAVAKTLHAVNRTSIRALLWMIPCTEHRSKVEAFELMKLFMDMIGNSIPIIAIFNPGSPKNYCVKDASEFQSVAKQHNIMISEVIDFNAFSLHSVQTRYSEKFCVMVPGNLRDILQKRDPMYLASQLKSLRELKCQELPQDLRGVQAAISQNHKDKKTEDSVAICKLGRCDHINSPTMRDCTSTVCVARDTSCGGWGPFRNCDTYCSKSQVVEDQGCIQANNEAAQRNKLLMSQCEQAAKEAQSSCMHSRAATLEQMKNFNEDLHTVIQQYEIDAGRIRAQMRTCDSKLEL